MGKRALLKNLFTTGILPAIFWQIVLFIVIPVVLFYVYPLAPLVYGAVWVAIAIYADLS